MRNVERAVSLRTKTSPPRLFVDKESFEAGIHKRKSIELIEAADFPKNGDFIAPTLWYIEIYTRLSIYLSNYLSIFLFI